MELLLGLLHEGLLYQGWSPTMTQQTYAILPCHLVFPNTFTLPIPLAPKLTRTVTSQPSWPMAIQNVIDIRQTWEIYVEKWQQQWDSLARKAKCWRKWNAARVMIRVLKEVGKMNPSYNSAIISALSYSSFQADCNQDAIRKSKEAAETWFSRSVRLALKQRHPPKHIKKLKWKRSCMGQGERKDHLSRASNLRCSLRKCLSFFLPRNNEASMPLNASSLCDTAGKVAFDNQYLGMESSSGWLEACGT